MYKRKMMNLEREVESFKSIGFGGRKIVKNGKNTSDHNASITYKTPNKNILGDLVENNKENQSFDGIQGISGISYVVE